MTGTVYFDLETYSADRLFHEKDFVRLAGYAIDDGPVRTTTDPAELIAVLNNADEVVGHNVMSFDLMALSYHCGADWEALAAKARDTLILARLDDPPRARETGGSQDRYDLDTISEKFGVTGKTADLKDLKKEFGGFEKIPTDDRRFVDYLVGDVEATRAVAKFLPMTEYGAREHKLAALAGRMTSNGFRVDVPLLNQRIHEGDKRKAIALVTLNKKYGIPLTDPKGNPFASPLATLVGKAALVEALARLGVTHYPTTEKTGAIKAGREGMAMILAHYGELPGLRELCELVTIVTTIRTVYATALLHLEGDRVHPKISFAQASGRWSVSSPGLTVFGKNGGRHHERAIFLPEPGHSILAADLSQIDMRACAGLSQDTEYMKLFAPGMDVHREIAAQVFGSADRRQDAKKVGHGYNYGMQAKRMIEDGLDPDMVNGFIKGMEERFPRMIQWRNEIRKIGKSGALLNNGHGRLMRCEPSRAFTQAPALMGQGCARDLMCDALLRLPDELRPMLRTMVHDEIVLSVPNDRLEEVGRMLKEAMTTEWRGVPITCDLSKPGRDWSVVSEK